MLNQPDYTKIGAAMQAYQSLNQEEKRVVHEQILPYAMGNVIMQPKVDWNVRARFLVIAALIGIVFIAIVGLIVIGFVANNFSQQLLTIVTTILGYLAGVITPQASSSDSPKKV